MTSPTPLILKAREILAKLTPAQKRALLGASWREQQSLWRPEGYYCTADKRVRSRLCFLGLIRDYLSPSNRLTTLGLTVRDFLKGLRP